MYTYPEFTLVLDARGKSIYHVVSELVFSDIKVLKSIVASQIREECTKCVIILNDSALEGEGLQFGQVCHLLGQTHDGFVRKHGVRHSDLVAAYPQVSKSTKVKEGCITYEARFGSCRSFSWFCLFVVALFKQLNYFYQKSVSLL